MPIQSFPIVQILMTKNFSMTNPWYRGWKAAGGKPIGIVVHSNGCQGVPARGWPTRASWNGPLAHASVHAFIDSKEIIQGLPLTVRSGHCGGKANNTHLSLELSEPKGDTAADFEATWDRLVYLLYTWCMQFGISPKNIISHHEAHMLGLAGNHGDVTSDPGYKYSSAKPWVDPKHNFQGYFTRNGHTMDQLRAAVSAALKDATPPLPPAKPPQPKPKTPREIALQMLGTDLTIEQNDARFKLVTQVQTMLNQHGAKLKVDGRYGPLTADAVRDYQHANRLLVDGVVGVNTLTSLLS